MIKNINNFSELIVRFPFDTIESGQSSGMIKKDYRDIIFYDSLKKNAIQLIRKDAKDLADGKIIVPAQIIKKWQERFKITDKELWGVNNGE